MANLATTSWVFHTFGETEKSTIEGGVAPIVKVD
jgi:hypothetical protein